MASLPSSSADVSSSANADVTWFRDAKFGLFIHYGLYSIPAGVWHGQRIGRNNYAEWIRMQHNWPNLPIGIPKAEYDTLLPQFNPTHFDADQICREAAAAGMKYFVITTKHHDGFALFHSQFSKYSVESTPSKRDLIAEITAAGRKHNLKVGFYYSHWLDWEFPGGGLPPWPENKGDPAITQPSDSEYEHYWVTKCLPQVAELAQKFSPDLFWFDSWGQGTKSQLTPDRLSRLIATVRKVNPQILINSRIGTETGVDYLSNMDNSFPEKYVHTPWETSGTMNDSWGFFSLDNDYKPTKTLLRYLIDNASRNGNFQLNIGPRGDGSIPPACWRRLRDLASWMSINSRALHGTRPVPAPEPAWGRLLQKGNSIFAHVYDWPAAGIPLPLPKLDRPVKSATILETQAPAQIETRPDNTQQLLLPHTMPDDRASVIELHLT